ncbi:MAG: hypothetical protein C7B46_12415 [Sulfobacillus benefaciens]|uniref:Uncharacterized protein n=1 Tax=Sulfobacillus benefaciens TaxID=453960 RepID=A0A2T2XEM7_9FIRM|nr:MAG: hypothetical protein C7B46_12415 [Sulfobacillus benefaciens]
MQHRHLVTEISSNTAVVADILERGTLADWRKLAREVCKDPQGPYARAVRRVVENTHFYGTTILWKDFLNQCQEENRGTP